MKKKDEIKKMEKLIIENFAKVYNRIKPINENVVNEFGTVGHYIAKALSVEPTEDRDGLYYNVVDNNAGDDYTLIFDFEVIHEKGEGLYGKRRMYFREDSIFGKPNEELAELAEGEIAMEFEGDFKYKKYDTSWSSEVDITNDLSEDTKNKLTEILDGIAEGSFETFIDNDDDDGNMSDSEFHRWANPNMR
jgi:hypothetical protein